MLFPLPAYRHMDGPVLGRQLTVLVVTTTLWAFNTGVLVMTYRHTLVSLFWLVGCSALLAQAPATMPASAPTTRPSGRQSPTIAAPKAWNEKTYNTFIARHAAFMKDKQAALAKGPIQLVLIGDSITDCWRWGGKPTLDKEFGQWNPYNIGIVADETEHVLWRIDQGELDGIEPNPKAAMIMIGTNNIGGASAEEIADGIGRIVAKVHEKLPKTKILLLGIFPRAEKADDPVRAMVKAVNDIICKLDDGGKTVTYLDIGSKFLAEDGTLPKEIMPDLLHPNEKGYQIWADAVKPTLDAMMK